MTSQNFTLDIWEGIKLVLDATAFGTAVAAILAIVPAISAILSLVWVIIRIKNELKVSKNLDKKE